MAKVVSLEVEVALMRLVLYARYAGSPVEQT